PRLLWPDKPSVNDANMWYQVTYGLTAPKDLQRVSIAVGTLTESYINFGWLGLPMIMLPLGMLLGFFQRIFLGAGAGLVLSCTGAALVPELLAIESQLGQYLAGIVQQIAVALLVLLPLLHFYRCSAKTSPPVTVRFVRLRPGRASL